MNRLLLIAVLGWCPYYNLIVKKDLQIRAAQIDKARSLPSKVSKKANDKISEKTNGMRLSRDSFALRRGHRRTL